MTMAQLSKSRQWDAQSSGLSNCFIIFYNLLNNIGGPREKDKRFKRESIKRNKKENLTTEGIKSSHNINQNDKYEKNMLEIDIFSYFIECKIAFAGKDSADVCFCVVD